MLGILGKRNLMAGTDGFIYITLNTSYDLPLPIKKSKKQVCSFSNNTQQPISKYWNRFWPSITIGTAINWATIFSHLNCYSNLWTGLPASTLANLYSLFSTQQPDPVKMPVKWCYTFALMNWFFISLSQTRSYYFELQDPRQYGLLYLFDLIPTTVLIVDSISAT